MTPERWQRVKEIFQSALQLAPGERSVYLAGACGDDQGLRQEVESLIASHEKPGEFIDSPAYAVAAEMILDDKADLQPGETIGAYRIVSFIGRGGMGEIYLAEDTRLSRKVALKFLSPDFVNDADRVRRFEQEARAASALNQPSILTIHEIGEHDGRRYLCTEFVEGLTLRQTMQARRLTVSEVLDITEQIAAALAAAHAAGIIHRDIKPENVMVRSDGLVKVLDFGLAKLTGAGEGPNDFPTKNVETITGQVMGTVTYMSPEQARGLTVDARTDIWSLGVVLYEMIAGKRPFDGSTASDVLVSVLDREPQPLDITSLGVPEALELMIFKALTKERDLRYQSAREFVTDIRRLKQAAHVDVEHERRASLPVTPSGGTPSSGIVDSAIRDAQVSPKEQTRAQVANALKNRWVLSAAAVLVLGGLIIGAITLLARWRAGKSITATEVLRTTQITTRPGSESPALSPDGNSIAYASRSGEGASEIYVKLLTPGAREIQLTFDGGRNTDLAWSPDGKWIAYRSGRLGGIWTIPSTGGSARQLTTFGAQPSWSADASLIVFQSEPSNMPPTTIWKVQSRGGDPVQITRPGTPEGGHSTPVWSPHGERIMFVASPGYFPGQLWTVSAQGGDLRQTSRDNAISFGGPIYSPDGKSVYSGGFTATNNSVIYKIPISPAGDATAAPEIVKDVGLAHVGGNLSMSADGKKLLYGLIVPTGELVSVLLSPGSNEVSGEPRPLIQNNAYRKGLPCFSRDGRHIAYQQWSAGENQKVWVADAEGANARQLTSGPEPHWSCSWLPDNDTIVFLAHSQGQQQVRSVSLSTGREKPLFTAPQSMGLPRISPDGRVIAFMSAKGETINVWATSANGDDLRQLTFDRETIGWPSWSPDGKTIAVQIKRGSNVHLGIMPSSGGEVTQLTFDDGSVLSNDWSPDGDKILFSGRVNGIWNVYWYSLSTKEQKQLTRYTTRTHSIRYPSWSPLGNQIVYEYLQSTGSLWLMEMK